MCYCVLNLDNFAKVWKINLNLYLSSRHHIRLQRHPTGLRPLLSLRNPLPKSETNQRLPLGWHGHLQRSRSLHDHSTRHACHWRPAECCILLRLHGEHLLLLSVHGSDFCAQVGFYSKACSWSQGERRGWEEYVGAGKGVSGGAEGEWTVAEEVDWG